MVSLDGFIEGENNDIDWHVFDDEMGEYMLNFMDTVDTFIYGRRSYELMLEYWPKAEGHFADVMNETPKIVFSKTLDKVIWNSRLVNDNVWEEMNAEKRKPGKDMVLFAGADLLTTFINLDLVDEYRLIVNPVVLGAGTPYFKDLHDQLNLKLTDSKTFTCGNVVLCYEPIRN